MAKGYDIVYLRGTSAESPDLTKTLRQCASGARVFPVATTDELRSLLQERGVDCVVSEYDLGDDTGLDACQVSRELVPAVPFVLVPAESTGRLASDAVANRVNAYVPQSEFDEHAVGEKIASVLDSNWGRTEESAWLPTSAGDSTTILERVEDAFIAVDDEWRVTYLNPSAAALLDYPRSDIVGRNIWQEFPEALESGFYEPIVDAMETQEPRSFREYYAPLDLWAEANVYPAPDGLSVYIRDISDQHQREQTVDGLLTMAREMMHAGTVGAVCDSAMDAIEELLDFDFGIVRVVEDGELRVVSRSTTTDDGDRERALARRVFETGEPALEAPDDTESDRALLCIPLGSYGTMTVGVADGGLEGPRLAIVEILAAMAVAALRRTEREQDLRRYERVLETIQEMVFVIDESGRFTLVTEPLADRLGYGRSALLGRRATAVFDGVDELVANVYHGELFEALDEPIEVVAESGERFPARIDLSVLPSETQDSDIVGVVHDVSELTATRRRLTAERERFSSLYENLPDP
ncbi:MAG: PAS domain S-box protein, partial [Halobacteriota archaeon]